MMARMARNYWYAAGYAAMLVGVLADIRKGKSGVPGLGRAGRGSTLASVNKALPTDVLPGENDRARSALARADGVLEKGTLHTVRNIDERVSYIKKRINEDSLKPQVREAAIALVSKKCGTKNGVRWCISPKDYGQEIRAVYEAVQNSRSAIALRYVRDHAKVDQFTAADKLMRLRGGDCDDGTILLGSLLMSIGYPVRMRVMQDTASSTWSHIYLLVGVSPGNPEAWIPLDWSVYPFKPAGWQVPGADGCARTGKPSGFVTRLKDYPV